MGPQGKRDPRTYGRVFTTSFCPISIYNCIKCCSKERRQIIWACSNSASKWNLTLWLAFALYRGPAGLPGLKGDSGIKGDKVWEQHKHLTLWGMIPDCIIDVLVSHKLISHNPNNTAWESWEHNWTAWNQQLHLSQKSSIKLSKHNFPALCSLWNIVKVL